MAAGITVKISVLSSIREWDERFTPTTTRTEAWVFETNLDNYDDDLNNYLATPYNYMQDEITSGAVCKIHYGLVLENITAAPPPKGGIVQPKGHFDASLTQEAASTVEEIKAHMIRRIISMQTKARY